MRKYILAPSRVRTAAQLQTVVEELTAARREEKLMPIMEMVD